MEISPRAAVALLAASLLLAPLARAREGPAGEIQFSDGTVVTGRVFFTSGTQLKLHGSKQLTVLAPAGVSEIRFAPEKEQRVRKWRFAEAGQTRKEYWGDPYPIRELRATVRMRSGEVLHGHLYTVPVYIEGAGRTKKVVLWAKQRGKEKETLDELVYPVRVLLAPAAEGARAEPRRLALPPELAAPGAEATALVLGALVAVPVRGDAAAGTVQIDVRPDDPLILAVRNGDRVVVGWPAEADPALRARLEQADADVRDFFDRRQLLGVYRDPKTGDVFTLLLLSREAQTTLGGKKNRPWRVGVWRWVYQEEEDRLMVAGRGYLARGIGEKGDLPGVTVSRSLWQAGAPAGAQDGN